MFLAKRNQKTAPSPAAKPASGVADGIAQRLFSLKQNWYKNTDITRNNYELGLSHFKQGNIGDAVFRFRLVTWLEPAHADAWYYLGRARLAEGKPVLAAAALRKSLELKPGQELAFYFLALADRNLRPDQLPRTMPRQLVTDHFEKIAAGYNEEHLQNFEYKGHLLLASAVREQLIPGRIDHVIVELGVGTGLCGSQLRDVAAHITGVDSSGKMLVEAMKVQTPQGRKSYDALIHRDAMEFLKEVAPESADIVLACGLASYMGDVTGLFMQVARVLKPGGLFALTAEKTDGTDYRFDPTAGMFRFPLSYVQQLAAHVGLSDVKSGEGDIYPDTRGLVCIFRK